MSFDIVAVRKEDWVFYEEDVMLQADVLAKPWYTNQAFPHCMRVSIGMQESGFSFSVHNSKSALELSEKIREYVIQTIDDQGGSNQVIELKYACDWLYFWALNDSMFLTVK